MVISMNPAAAIQHLADVSSMLVLEADLAGVLVRITGRAVEVTGATSGGVLVRNRDDELELLAATSHRAGDLETWQAAAGEGPCVVSMDEQRAISVSAAEAAELSPEFAHRMDAVGYRHVLATPLRWHGRALGGLNLFWRNDAPDAEAALVAQAFADAVTLGIIASGPLPDEETWLRVDEALQGRVVIERAKGVLAHQESLSMEDAFDRLLELAAERDEPLTGTAEQVIATARLGGRDPA
jgi:hypothetical protein